VAEVSEQAPPKLVSLATVSGPKNSVYLFALDSNGVMWQLDGGALRGSDLDTDSLTPITFIPLPYVCTP
jgi:hypothetical protein